MWWYFPMVSIVDFICMGILWIIHIHCCITEESAIGRELCIRMIPFKRIKVLLITSEQGVGSSILYLSWCPGAEKRLQKMEIFPGEGEGLQKFHRTLTEHYQSLEKGQGQFNREVFRGEHTGINRPIRGAPGRQAQTVCR